MLPVIGSRTFLVDVHLHRQAWRVNRADAGWAVDLRVEVRPRWQFGMPRFGGLDGLSAVRGGVLHRLLHSRLEPVLVRVAQLGRGRSCSGRRPRTETVAQWGIERMRLALGVDQDLQPFHRRFRFDPLIGAAYARDPGLRIAGRPDPFEALTWAICEQLIEYDARSRDPATG